MKHNVKTMNRRKASNKVVKRNAKSSVFTHLFSLSRYKKELYLCFHPKDKNIDESEIKTWTLSSIFTNIQVNDLGILVKDTILLLMEAQSTWTLNILPRVLEYLGESFNRYVIETKQNIYGEKKVKLPKPELYVLYTGNKVIKEKEISFKKEFYNNEGPVDIRIKVITTKNSSKVLKEYIEFSKILDKNNKVYGYTKKSINETIKYCIAHNILRDYLNEYKKEVCNIMTSVYDQKTATDMYGNERYAEGMQQGLQRGMLKAFVEMVKDKIITIKEAAKRLGVSETEFAKLAKI